MAGEHFVSIRERRALMETKYCFSKMNLEQLLFFYFFLAGQF